MTVSEDTSNVSRETRRRGVRAFTHEVMGMTVSLHVRAAAPTRADITQAAKQVWAELDRADATFSTYRTDSELMRLRRGDLPESEASEDMLTVRALCAEAKAVTNGLFTDDLIAPDGTRGFDPTGLVKGWSVEQAGRHLKQIPGIVYCVNAAGDMTAGLGAGPIPADIPTTWNVGITNPSNNAEVIDTVTLEAGQSLATSGTGERGRHITDPRTGEPLETERRSVTVIGTDLTWTDVWATAAFIDPDALAFSRMAASYRVAVTL